MSYVLKVGDKVEVDNMRSVKGAGTLLKIFRHCRGLRCEVLFLFPTRIVQCKSDKVRKLGRRE